MFSLHPSSPSAAAFRPTAVRWAATTLALLAGFTANAQQQRGVPQPSTAVAKPCTTCPPPPILQSCNLILNGTFDGQNQTPACSNFNIKGPASYTNDVLRYWWSANSSVPYYYATNLPCGAQPGTPPVRVPNASGIDGMVRLMYVQDASTTDPSARDYQYLTQQINKPLAAGAYYASFWTYRYGQNPVRLGMNLTTSSPEDYTTPWRTYSFNKGIQSAGTLNGPGWEQVKGKFTVSGADANQPHYATIGLFTPAQLANPDYHGHQYYYIDDVELYQIPEAGPSQCINSGASVRLGTVDACLDRPFSVQWTGPNGFTSNSPQITVSPTQTSTYILTAMLPDGTTHQTQTTVAVDAPYAEDVTFHAVLGPFNPQSGNYMCKGSQLRLDVTVPNYGAQFNNALITLSLPYIPTSDYTLTAGTQVGGTRTFYFTPNVPAVGQGERGFTFVASVMENCIEHLGNFTIVAVNAPDIRNAPCNNDDYYSYPRGAAAAPAVATAVFPSPADASLQVTAPKGTTTGYIYNDKGRLVRTVPLHAGSQELDTRTWSEGIYYLRTDTKGQNKGTRIQVRH
jgi:hypothetical protein